MAQALASGAIVIDNAAMPVRTYIALRAC
jgi:hypothetical protein